MCFSNTSRSVESDHVYSEPTILNQLMYAATPSPKNLNFTY